MTHACVSLFVRLKYTKDFVSSESRSGQFPDDGRHQDARKELPDESEVVYVRKELDREILPAKIIPEHADHGPAHCNAVEPGLGNHDGNLPFW